MAIHGTTWVYMAVNGNTWLYMAVHDWLGQKLAGWLTWSEALCLKHGGILAA